MGPHRGIKMILEGLCEGVLLLLKVGSVAVRRRVLGVGVHLALWVAMGCVCHRVSVQVVKTLLEPFVAVAL